MRADRFPQSKCLNCGYKLDAATSADLNDEDKAPHPGAVSVCIACSHIMLFTDDMALRNPTIEELESIVQDDDVLRVLMALKRTRDVLGPPPGTMADDN